MERLGHSYPSVMKFIVGGGQVSSSRLICLCCWYSDLLPGYRLTLKSQISYGGTWIRGV